MQSENLASERFWIGIGIADSLCILHFALCILNGGLPG
jgi:hypothetical protein